ncbi:hypothetical protein DFJ73DRAFT_869287 [Zopfochytrium polystomum]|nr:hypothetical protein DFJ73DRAFT_869287 [Zopfochytrium polystomum]
MGGCEAASERQSAWSMREHATHSTKRQAAKSQDGHAGLKVQLIRRSLITAIHYDCVVTTDVPTSPIPADAELPLIPHPAFVPPCPEIAGARDVSVKLARIREDFRVALIYLAAVLIDSVSPAALNGGVVGNSPAIHVATLRFAYSIVMWSRASFYDLQLALFYMIRWNLSAKSPPHIRFLATLLLAFKYLHDRAPPLPAWARAAGVPTATLVDAERAAVIALVGTLHINPAAPRGGDGGFGKFCIVAAGRAKKIAGVEGRVEEVRREWVGEGGY